MASVDVVVPCYNYGRYLRRCVESILAQEKVDVRVLIIDDTSTDDTPAVSRALAEGDSRVQFRRHPTNLGHIATYNEGLLEWASADYSLLISADDLVTPGCLARATEVLDKFPEVGMAYGSALIFYDEDYPMLAPVSPDFTYRIASSSTFLERCYLIGNPVPTACAVVRTATQHALGKYDPSLPFTADMDLWMRFAGLGPIAIIKPIQALYRKHSSAMSRGYYELYNRDRRELIATGDRVASQLGDRFPEVAHFNGAMRRRLALQSCWDAGEAIESGNPEQFAACIEFAREADPSIRLTAPWMRLQVKRMLGGRLLRAMKRAGGKSDGAPAAEVHSREFGWWE